jgi:hypothetical protein
LSFVLFFFLFYLCFSASLLAVLIKISKGVARALLLLRLLLLLLHLLRLPLLHLLPLLPLDLRTPRGRRERPELLHDGRGQSRLLGNHLVKEADTRGSCGIALVIAKHDVAPSPFVIHQLTADRICAQDGIEGGEGAQVVLHGDLL